MKLSFTWKVTGLCSTSITSGKCVNLGGAAEYWTRAVGFSKPPVGGTRDG